MSPNEEKNLQRARSLFAKQGGEAKFKKYGPEHYAEMGRRSGESKRKKKKKNDVDNSTK